DLIISFTGFSWVWHEIGVPHIAVPAMTMEAETPVASWSSGTANSQSAGAGVDFLKSELRSQLFGGSLLIVTLKLVSSSMVCMGVIWMSPPNPLALNNGLLSSKRLFVVSSI